MLACRLSAGLFVAAFGVWLLALSWRRACAVVACALLACIPWACFHWSIYGDVLGPSTGQMFAAYWGRDIAQGVLGVLVSPSHGLLVYQPWVLLIGAVCVPGVRRRFGEAGRGPTPTGWPVFCCTVIVLHLLTVGSWCCWWGGTCWGSRLAADVIPLCALLCLRPLAVLQQKRYGLWVLAALLILSLVAQVPGAYRIGAKSCNGHAMAWQSPFHHALLRR